MNDPSVFHCPRCRSQTVKVDELGVFYCGECGWDRDRDLERVRKFKELTAPKPGRNAPCSCGSGKKYKFCCLNRKEKTGSGDPVW